ncbi:MAG: adenylyl-sulfate kinase [Gammaproteobacteria bacterium]|nr:MAG: adenylyl-sulfate kinase [Gammaproteobacteria bacterium]
MTTMLRFIACGSVDDGKSTLIGRMLYDSKQIYIDQEQALIKDSKQGSRGGDIDFALLLDGLSAEREQGITIDVAYRYFSTDRRSFIVADTPGHEQYTRNMAVGASCADLALILVDAMNGVMVQTKRHSRICSLMGIKHIVLVINKMDLIEYDKGRFEDISQDYLNFASNLGFDSIEVIPVSATDGVNIVEKSLHTSWYKGDSLLKYLEEIDITTQSSTNGFLMPVQRVSRPDSNFRGFQGQIESGSVAVGDEVGVLPGSEKAKIKSIISGFENIDCAIAGQAVNITLDREVDISRGSVLIKNSQPAVADLFTATILWMDDASMIAGRSYFLKIGTKQIAATIIKVKHKVDINSGSKMSADSIIKNEIAVCDIALSEKIVFDKYISNKTLGAFILIDRVSNMTSACGVIEHQLDRSDNITWQKTDITKADRLKQKGQKSLTLWFTGLSGSGKSSLANEVEKKLVAMGKHTMLLDGDNIRHGLSRNLGFKEGDRVENIRRIAEVSKLMNNAGLIVLTAFISPFEKDRQAAKEIIGDDFFEIYLSTPIEECEKRDVKGLYKKARAGVVANFTGVSSPYEEPSNPDITIDTSENNLSTSTSMVVSKILDLIE